MIEFKRFGKEDFERFKSWISSQSYLLQFAGPVFTYPVTDEQLVAYVSDPRRSPYKVCLTDTGEVIGHCELNFERSLPRLCRVLVADEGYRSKGLGKQIINKMLEKLFIEKGFESADLNVFDWNIQAIKCYERVGFVMNEGVVNQQQNGDEIWLAMNMVISKDQWLKFSDQ